MIDNIEEQNILVKEWFAETLQHLKNRYISFTHSINRSGEGLDSLKFTTRSHFGVIDQGGFSFERHLIFMHKGAGKGKGGAKGSKWYDPHGQIKTTNPLSLNKMNTGNRHEEPWLNPVLDEDVPKLADIVAGFKADLAVKQIQIK
jgi:hypothetical protein